VNPCVGCKRKGDCPKKCKPKADYARHMKRINRKMRMFAGEEQCLSVGLIGVRRFDENEKEERNNSGNGMRIL
jgi:hypothetical protein